MKNNITELVFILDRSGSMAGLEKDTVGGFNAMLEKQKRQDGACFVTTVLFNTVSARVHDRVPLARVAPMKESDYCPGGCTALLDAIGETVEHIASIHKYIRPEDVPEHTVFVITTDGMENSSRKFSSDAVKKLIKKMQEERGWEFLFVAANIDAVETASNLGVSRDRAVNYNSDGIGTKILYETVSDAVSCVRSAAPLAPGWGKRIDEDYKKRRRH